VADITTNGQTIDTGAGDIVTTDVDALTGTSDTLDGTSSTFTTFSDNAVTTIAGGDTDANSVTIDTLDGTTATFTTFDDGTVTRSGEALSDGTNSITMDGTDATVDLHNGDNALLFDAAGASMTASDGTTTHGLWVGTTDTVLSAAPRQQHSHWTMPVRTWTTNSTWATTASSICRTG